jgi:hypothetical protein
MTKVTLNETPPSVQVVAKASAASETIDPRGRIISLKKPGVLAQFRLIEALGDTAKNEVYVSMVLPLIFVCAIDGDPVTPPTRKSEVEALIQRLDEDGIATVMEAVKANYGSSDPEADKAALKN